MIRNRVWPLKNIISAAFQWLLALCIGVPTLGMCPVVAKFLEKITSVGWDTHVGCEAPSPLGMGVGLNMHIHGLAL